jgi:hypothetical protein
MDTHTWGSIHASNPSRPSSSLRRLAVLRSLARVCTSIATRSPQRTAPTLSTSSLPFILPHSTFLACQPPPLRRVTPLVSLLNRLERGTFSHSKNLARQSSHPHPRLPLTSTFLDCLSRPDMTVSLFVRHLWYSHYTDYASIFPNLTESFVCSRQTAIMTTAVLVPERYKIVTRCLTSVTARADGTYICRPSFYNHQRRVFRTWRGRCQRADT